MVKYTIKHLQNDLLYLKIIGIRYWIHLDLTMSLNTNQLKISSCPSLFLQESHCIFTLNAHVFQSVMVAIKSYDKCS